jgi:hypothetical protein
MVPLDFYYFHFPHKRIDEISLGQYMLMLQTYCSTSQISQEALEKLMPGKGFDTLENTYYKRRHI